MAVPKASFATDTLTSRLTNPVFKSHILRNHLEPWQRKILNPQNLVVQPRGRRTPLLHPRLFTLNLCLQFCSVPICSRFLLPCRSISLLHRLRSRPFASTMSSLTSTPNSDATPDAKTVRAVIKGRVQGVFYRDWTVGNAKELGLKGWVRNRRDGTVEALFSGSPEKVQEMEQRCRRGPPSAIVTGLDVFPCDDDPAPGFERRPTV